MTIQKERFYTAMITILAAIRVAWEHVRAFTRSIYKRVKANKTACKAFHIAGVCLLACLSIVLYTVVIFRVASKQAVEKYEVHLAAVRAQEEAAALAAAEVDPYVLQLQYEATWAAKALNGIYDFHYGTDNKRTFLQGVYNRMLNEQYPSDIKDVLLQPDQFDFVDVTNKVYEADYQLAYEFFDNAHQSERLACSPDLVIIELGRDKVTLRDTLNKTGATTYWRYGM